MRTTIEIKPELRARVLDLAAARGEKNLSAVVADALDLYLDAEEHRTSTLRNALAVRGSIKPREAAALSARTSEIRANWR